MNPSVFIGLAVIGAVVSVTAIVLAACFGAIWVYQAVTRSQTATHIGQVKRRLFK